MQTNLGTKPLGRGETVSPRVQAENVALKLYRAALQAAGPANTEAAGKLHRKAWDRYDLAIRLL